MDRCNELCTKETTGACALCDALAERERFERFWKYRLLAVLEFIGLLVLAPASLRLLLNPTWGPVIVWGIILLGSAVFVWTFIRPWYPVMKKHLSLARVGKVLALAWLPGYCGARYILNSLTGVDAGYFPIALWVFTLGSIAYVWLNLFMLWLFVISLKALVVMGGLWLRHEGRTFLWDLIHLGCPKPSLPIGRHGKALFASFCFMGLIAMSFDYLKTSRTLEIVGNLVLMGTEFSHDRTCAASSATQWVIPLKDRKEFKATNVLVATYHAWNNISFKIDQCDLQTPSISSGAR